MRRRTVRAPISPQARRDSGILQNDANGHPYSQPTSEVLAGAGAGDVVGPSASTAKAIARFASTTGKLLEQGPSGPPPPKIEDDGRISTVTDPTGAQDAATKAYVDAATIAPLALTADPGSPANKQWWFFLDGGTPENLSLRIRRGGVTYEIAIGTLI